MTSMAATSPEADDVSTAFRSAMRRLASAVAIVTAEGPDGPTGMAATSITSLTMDPPAILVCVNRSASLHSCLAEGASFSVSLLAKNQKDISAAFGGAVPRSARFTVGEWSTDSNNLPILEQAQANLSCNAEVLIPYGTHTVVIGRVNAVRLSGDVDPLIYQDGKYL